MKRLYFVFASLLCISIFQSCSKESPNTLIAIPASNAMNVTIAPNQPYELNLNSSGIVSVSRQASHFKISETSFDSKTGFVVYKYIPATDYIGEDEVILSNTKAADASNSGCPGNHSNNNDNTTYNTSYTIIKLNISN